MTVITVMSFRNRQRIINQIYNPKIIIWVTGIVILFLLCLLSALRQRLFFQCPCLKETKTQERVARYLPSLMNEWSANTNRTAAEDAELQHQSLAVKFLTELEAKGRRCSSLPGIHDIRHRNTVWQEAIIGTTTYLLFSAFVDYRDEKEGPLIRILSMADSSSPPTPTCHLYNNRNNSEPPVATKAIKVDFLHWDSPKEGEWHPYMITCLAGRRVSEVPNVVSVVPHPCSLATNALRVIQYDRTQPKKNMALCQKFLFNPAQDFSSRMTEWIEAARAWGIDHVTVYVAASHPNVIKVLHYYEKKKFLTVMSWTNPGTQMNVPSLLRTLYDTNRYALFTDENIPYTDCFLRHIGTHRYVGVWDLDEFIFPVGKNSIPDMVDEAMENWKVAHRNDPNFRLPSSYLARSSYFFDDAIDTVYIEKQVLDSLRSENSIMEQYMSFDHLKRTEYISHFHMLSHVIRTVKLSPPTVFTKSIHDTSRALGLHAHFALYNIDGPIDREKDLYHLYPTNEGFLGHFRSKCQGENQSECNESFRPYLTRDETMWNHWNEIFWNTKYVLETLALL